MMGFIVYEGKVAAALLVFYLFYRFLLKKETFHRFNRIVLVATAVLSFVLPLCIITIHKPVEVSAAAGNVFTGVAVFDETSSVTSQPWWHIALSALFWSGAAIVLIRLAVSVASILRIVRTGKPVKEDDGTEIIVTGRDIDPFSWMRYIVLSQQDWEAPHDTVVAHEKAHVRNGHSVELLLVDILSALQWFNPAIWMLRSDLQELHEYEADDAVLRGGADIKDYQYLLIRKAVCKSGYSVANSFNHSTLKDRITMMSKSKSPLARGWRAVYMLPLVCLALGLQAQTVYVPAVRGSASYDNQVHFAADTLKAIVLDGSTPSLILKQEPGKEREITQEEMSKIDPGNISSISVIKDASAIGLYGEKAKNGVVTITLKNWQELNDIVVVSYGKVVVSYGKEKEESGTKDVMNPDTMPEFRDGDMSSFVNWITERIHYPEGCTHTGNMKVGFLVDTDGKVKDVQILENVCEKLDEMVLSLVSSSPRWDKPAMSNGKPVPQFLTVPIEFQVR